MNSKQDITKLIQSHYAIEFFDYDVTVDWALELAEKGIETENVYMLASFSKPVDSIEIRPFVNAVLFDLGLQALGGTVAVWVKIKYHIVEIVNGFQNRKNLDSLWQVFHNQNCFNNDEMFGLMPFYILHNAWSDLDYNGVNYCSTAKDVEEIEIELKNEAIKWLDIYSHKIPY